MSLNARVNKTYRSTTAASDIDSRRHLLRCISYTKQHRFVGRQYRRH